MTAVVEEPQSVVDTGVLPTGRMRTAALISLLLASAMELVDTSIVNIALPSIEADLGATGAQLQWMVAAYPLAFAVALITGSRLGDAFGRKRLFVIGMIAFTLTSAACGFAPDAATLIGFRVLQGFGAAAMVPQVLSNIQVMYAPHERATAMGAFTALAGLAVVIGPVLGSVLTEADIAGTGWRAIFLVNVPLGIGALLAAVRFIPESRSPRRPDLDLFGVITLALGLLCVLYPLTLGREQGWPVWIFVMIAGGLLVLTWFARQQRRTERAGREPLVALSLFSVRSFAGANGVLMVLFVAMSAFFLAQTIFLQAGLGWSVLKAGLAGIPFAIATSAMAGYGVTVLAGRIGRRVLQLGAVVLGTGALVFAVTAHLADPTTSVWAFLPAFVLTGCGFGLLVGPVGMFAVQDVPVDRAGSASGLFSTATQLSQAIGVSVLGTVFFEVVEARAPGAPSEVFAAGFQVVLLIVAALMVVAFAAARALPPTAPMTD